MREFSSYGPIDKEVHYYSPRKELIHHITKQLTGDNSKKGGHYITVWAPRQTGKTWLMQQVVKQIHQNNKFEVAIISLQSAKTIITDDDVIKMFIDKLSIHFKHDFNLYSNWKNVSCFLLKKFIGFNYANTTKWEQLFRLFSKKHFKKPVILIIDEFDALDENFINKFANEFRDMYISRQNEITQKSQDKTCLLHGLALVGVRSVLGIDNVKGSPFNVQRSIHIPNLTFDEVNYIYRWYEKESNQSIDFNVINRIYYEFKGQPGLTCWFGEQLTQVYNHEKNKPITLNDLDIVYAAAKAVLPNNNILNIISKAKISPYKETVLDLFKTDKKIIFSYDDIYLNYLYMNGVIDIDVEIDKINYFTKFASPFVQKRLFNYFSHELFNYMGQLVEPFTQIDHVINDNGIHIKNLMELYEKYLKKNKHWLLKDAPRRKDMKIFEAVYHFNLYMFLNNFLPYKKTAVWPEFPTGNGKIDILIRYANQIYGIELKTYTNESAYTEAIKQAVYYAVQLKINKIALVFFVDTINDENRQKYEKNHWDKITAVTVEIIFIQSGNDS